CNIAGLGVEYPYGSQPYVQQVDEGRIVPPAELYAGYWPQMVAAGARPNRLLTMDEVEQLAEATGNPALVATAEAQHSESLHAAQLYSTLTALLIAGVLVAFYTLWPPPGRVFALMLMLEGPTRVLLEALRVEPAVLG